MINVIKKLLFILLNWCLKFYSSFAISKQINKYIPNKIKFYLKNNINHYFLSQSFINLQLKKYLEPFYKHVNKKQPIKLKRSTKPLVSIIIPVFNNANETYKCLRSIEFYCNKLTYEVILVDDNSTDDTFKLFNGLNLKYIRNKKNMGFIENCNNASIIANGEFLYFLNNDAFLINENSIFSLIEIFNKFKSVGVVGSKLIYPNLLLQEAGGIIWNDGSAWNYGNGKNISTCSASYIREVDYVSGASFMVKKSLFIKLGKFDSLYKPMYCEDSDFCLKVRKNKLKVFFQPNSLVCHNEGSTSGNDLNSGFKKYQTINNLEFKKRWNQFLKNNDKNGLNVYKNFDRTISKKILIIDYMIPTPDRDAGSVTMYNNIIIFLNAGYHVTFISDAFYSNNELLNYYKNLENLGVFCLYPPEFYSVNEALFKISINKYDSILISRPLIYNKYIDLLKSLFKNTFILYECADLHFLRELRAKFYNPSFNKIKTEFKGSSEEIILNDGRISKFIVRSTYEENLLKKLLPRNNKVTYLKIPFDFKHTKIEIKKRYDLVFIGGFKHAPNIDAIKYFIHDILPFIQKVYSKIQLHVIGQEPPKDLLSLAKNNIFFHGFVENINPILSRTLISIAPLRFGAGVKGKIIQASQYGIPTVTSSIGIEGTGLTVNKNILIGDDPETFAKQVVHLISNKILYKKISQNFLNFGQKYKKKHHTDMFIKKIGLKKFKNCFQNDLDFY